MTRDEALTEIRRSARCEAYLQRSKSGLYCCPYCGSGTHGGQSSDGAVKVYPKTNTFFCHACHKSGDVIDLYREKTGADFNTALTQLATELRIQIDGKPEGIPEKPAEESEKEPANFTAYYMECAGRLNDPRAKTYLQKRGISQETAEAFLIGFDPEADPANAPGALEADHAYKPHPAPRLIVPSCFSHYVGRRIDGVKEYDKLNPKDATPGIFGIGELYAQDAQEVFITEGAFDAMSITEAGGKAIATNSAANADLLLADLKRKPTEAVLILCPDNDAAGGMALKTLQEGLAELGLPFITADICDGQKDPNDALTANREQFIRRVQEAQEKARAHRAQLMAEQKAEEEAKQEAQEARIRKYLENSAAARIPEFETEIRRRSETPAISTGFYSLDQLLDGGLYDGLYIMGAISSLGKTTFALQLMDNIAASGKDVLIFSLEMARTELMAKSISRETFLLSAGKTRNAKTTRGIMDGHRYANYSQAEADLIRNATEAYRKYAGRIYIVEGVGNVGTDKIKAFLEQHIEITGRRPVVLIDYLQLLAPADPHNTDKQNTDRAVLELKRMSRDFRIPVLAISSFNRDNYTAPVNLASFKESGAIEYSSDVLIGLQYTGMDYRDGEADKAREKRIRELFKEMENAAKDGGEQQIQVKILKNRNGQRGSAAFSYRPMFNYFSDGMDAAGFTPVKDEELPFNWNNAPIM